MEKKTDLFSAVKFVKKLHDIAGHWPKRTPTIKSEFRSLLSLILAITFLVTNLMEIVLHFSNFKDLAENLSVSAPVFTFILKMSVFKIKIGEFFKTLDLLEETRIFHPKLQRYSKFVQAMNDNVILLTKIYGGICSVVIILYAVLSLRSDNVLPIKFTYDFGPWVYAMYVFQMSAITNVCFSTVCLDTLVVSFLGIAIAQLQVLEQKIFDLFSEETDIFEKELRGRLSNCVVHHNRIIQFIAALEDIFNFFFLAQYMGSIFSICNIGFQLANIQPASVDFINMVCFFSAMLWQLATFCWFGNEIIIKSLAICDACYKSNWLKSNNSMRKSLMIIMTRANRQLALTAAKYSILSLRSLTSIMNASYSYFALMQRLYQDEQN